MAADPVSINGSVVGLISLGIQVTQSLINFYKTYRDQAVDLRRTTEKLEHLQNVLQTLEDTLLSRKFQEDERDLRKNIESSVASCDELIQELQGECRLFEKSSAGGLKNTIRGVGRRITYPFRQSTLQKLDEAVSEIRTNLSSALSVLHLKDDKQTHDDVAELKAVLDLVRMDQVSCHLRQWLNAPDATFDHHTACSKKYPNTGRWLVADLNFSQWLGKQNSVLWLNGFAGSGKSVLCSTAIQYVQRHQRSVQNAGIAFFYFKFDEKLKQDASAMIRALLLQLSAQRQDENPDSDLAQLYKSYETGMPPAQILLEYLRRLIERFQNVYIMLDALDESPRDERRSDVLAVLETMRTWGFAGLHLLLTSRDELDIRESLNLSLSQEIKMRSIGIDEDIFEYVNGRLDTDRRLHKWIPYRDKIQDALANRAKGVFRWVDCQFKSLERCPCSESHLDRLLSSLPQSLDETYERMLSNIHVDLIEDARRILTLLCFAARPLMVGELIDGVAVEIGTSPRLNRQSRLRDANDLHEICPGLIEVSTIVIDPDDSEDDQALREIVRIAHFSVQEYLESPRIQDSKAVGFALSSPIAHAEIAQVCLAYLLEPDLWRSMSSKPLSEEYPLARYSAQFWCNHYGNTPTPPIQVDELVLRLFKNQEPFETWVKIYDTDHEPPQYFAFDRSSDSIASPIYYASSSGLDKALCDLVTPQYLQNTLHQPTPSGVSFSVPKSINAQGGTYGDALQAASAHGHEKTVEILLNAGAEVNTKGGNYGSALNAASFEGHETIVEILLANGAEVNVQSYFIGTALQAASYRGHEKIVDILLAWGAEINARVLGDRNALEVASKKGFERVVKTLLAQGADVNAQDGLYGNALCTATSQGHEMIVTILIDHGADVNAVGGAYSDAALIVASGRGNEMIVKILLDRGAEVNMVGKSGTALRAAASRKNGKIIQILLDHGANIDDGGGWFIEESEALSHVMGLKEDQSSLEKGATPNVDGAKD